MKKLDLSGWAAVSEIVGSVAVVLSLLFVGYSVTRNTLALQAANDNFIFQIQDGILGDLARDAELANIIFNGSSQVELSEIEEYRYSTHGLRDMIMWELAYVRHKEGLFSAEQWEVWDRAYAIQFKSDFTDQWWADNRQWVRDDFAKHVDAMISSK